MKTILIALAHPDDEMGCAGTAAVHAGRGDRVVLLWLTRGTMTEALRRHPEDEVGRIRTEHGEQAAAIVGAEARFLDLPDTRLVAGPEPAAEVARVIAEVQPDAVITWGQAWVRGMRHPDHEAAGKIVRDAITLARIGRVVAPLDPHRGTAALFTLRDRHSTLPLVAVDVSPVLDTIDALARHYYERVGWPEPGWWRERIRSFGIEFDLQAAELFDAWESPPGVRDRLL